MTNPAPDAADLRTGVPIHDGLLALLPLVGVWQGSGTGVVAATGAEFSFGQQLRFAHDGRPFLAYESRSWLLDPDGAVHRLAWRESGFWRPGAGPDDIEVVLAANTGLALVLGGVAGELRWEIATSSAAPTPTARQVEGERRLYAVVEAVVEGVVEAVLEDELHYATELAPAGRPYAAHLNARLSRV